jgi:hypothetical protein
VRGRRVVEASFCSDVRVRRFGAPDPSPNVRGCLARCLFRPSLPMASMRRPQAYRSKVGNTLRSAPLLQSVTLSSPLRLSLCRMTLPVDRVDREGGGDNGQRPDRRYGASPELFGGFFGGTLALVAGADIAPGSARHEGTSFVHLAQRLRKHCLWQEKVVRQAASC